MRSQEETKFGPKDNIYFIFQADTETAGDVEGVPLSVRQRCTLSMHEKATLRKFITGWRGKRFASDDEAVAFDLETLVGTNAQIQITHTAPTDDGKIYANITACLPVAKGAPLLKPSAGYVRDKDKVGTDVKDSPFSN
jgi:hypothetical protein